jgi:hypothetical protein
MARGHISINQSAYGKVPHVALEGRESQEGAKSDQNYAKRMPKGANRKPQVSQNQHKST